MGSRVFRRGAVLAPPIYFIPATTEVEQTGFGFGEGKGDKYSDYLRFAAFYFDKAIMPQFSGVRMALTENENVLIERGFAEEREASFRLAHGGSLPDGRPWPDVINDDVINSLYGSQNARWSILDTNFDRRHLTGGKVNRFFIELIEQFPIPSDKCAIGDILNYNARNRDALIRFRNAIAKLAFMLSTAPNEPLIHDFVMDEVAASVAAIDNEAAKSLPMKYLSRLDLSLSIPSEIGNFLLSALGVPLSVSKPITNNIGLSLGRSSYHSNKLARDAEYVIRSATKGMVKSK